MVVPARTTDAEAEDVMLHGLVASRWPSKMRAHARAAARARPRPVDQHV
jgi:hypothetical protein